MYVIDVVGVVVCVDDEFDVVCWFFYFVFDVVQDVFVIVKVDVDDEQFVVLIDDVVVGELGFDLVDFYGVGLGVFWQF